MEYSTFKSDDEKSIVVTIQKILNDQNIQFHEINNTNTSLCRLLFIRYEKSLKINDLSLHIRVCKKAIFGITIDIGPVNTANDSIIALVKSQLI